jgi:tetraacyldisaccharide 4'-kinase
MNFNFPLLKPLRILLLPFSLVYWLVIAARNWCYDKQLFKSASFNLPVICVGNIAVGGTGKSPMVEFLIKRLKDNFKLATLSRGYKRKTKGYALARQNTSALEIGDEPMQFHIKFPDVAISVGEERLEAIPQLLFDRPDTQAIILDDAFQHRAVTCGLNIVLTDYNNLYTRDWYLPTGDLRDERKSVRRADIIVVTKCPYDITLKQKEAICGEIKPLINQEVFFSCIQYGLPYHLVSKKNYQLTHDVEVLLVTGIANPADLKKWVNKNSKAYYELVYNDHHIFTIDDLREIQEQFRQLTAVNKIILTTEKDAVRLVKFEQELIGTPIYVVPIKMEFLFEEEAKLVELVTDFITGVKKTGMVFPAGKQMPPGERKQY